MTRADDLRLSITAALAVGDNAAVKRLLASVRVHELDPTGLGALRRATVPAIGPLGPGVTTLFPPATTRPSTYPPELPFLAQTTTALIQVEHAEGGAMLQFYHVANPVGALVDLIRQSEENGWERGTAGAASDVEVVRFRRGTERRLVLRTLNAVGLIWLLDVPEDPNRIPEPATQQSSL